MNLEVHRIAMDGDRTGFLVFTGGDGRLGLNSQCVPSDGQRRGQIKAEIPFVAIGGNGDRLVGNLAGNTDAD